MYLRKKNLQMILHEYEFLSLFFDELEFNKRYINSEDKIIINNIIVYYSNLFELEFDLEPDVLRLDEMAKYNLRRIRFINRKLNKKSFSLLISMITYNLSYIGSIRVLGAS